VAQIPPVSSLAEALFPPPGTECMLEDYLNGSQTIQKKS
jgi:hypothetical protein